MIPGIAKTIGMGTKEALMEGGSFYGKQALKYVRRGQDYGGYYGRNLGRWAANQSGGYVSSAFGAALGSTVGRGAVTGAAIGGGTAIFDQDRSFIPGVIGGAFWGGVAAGAPRAMLQRRIASGLAIPEKLAMGGIRRGTAPAAGLTGAYGVGNWFMGRSRRRKSHRTFHHGEPL